MRSIIAIILILSGLNISAQEIQDEDFVGLYGKCEKGYFSCMQIELKPDSTFTYAQFYDVGGWHTYEGTWQHKYDGTIILNTFDKYEYSVNSVVEKTIENQDFTTLRVQLINRPIGKTEIKINNDSTYILGDLFGEISLPYIGVRTISIEKIFNWTDIGLEKYDFYTIDSSSNDITIIVKPYNIYHLMDYFVDYEIKIKNKKLFDWHKPNGKFDRKCYLKKTNIANKEF